MLSSELPTETMTSLKSNPKMRARNFNTSNTVTGIDKTVMIHEAWGVTWAASDRSTMSPRLPDMTSWMLVPTWTPGDVISDGMYSTETNHDGGFKGFVTIVIVVGVILMLAIIAIACVRGCTANECGKNRARRRDSEQVWKGHVLRKRQEHRHKEFNMRSCRINHVIITLVSEIPDVM